MTDARISTEFPNHPKTKRLIRRLGFSGSWHLLKLWLWAAANKPSGDLAGMTAEDIELAVDWPPEQPGEFVRVLIDVRFLVGRSEAYSLHDWQTWNPWASGADLRSAKARWNATKRHHGVAEADRQVPEWAAHLAAAAAAEWETENGGEPQNERAEDATSTGADAGSNAPSPYPSPYPSPSPKSKALGAVEIATLAGRTCRMMREVGCGKTNPSHAGLLEALAEGVPPETLAKAAAEAVDAGKGNPFAYAITTARNRWAEKLKGAKNGHSGKNGSGARSAAGRVIANVEEARRERGEDEPDDGRTLEGTATRVAR